MALAEGLVDILAEQHPMSVRGAFYQASTRGLVAKTEPGYRKVQQLLVKMRERRELPWGWITDGTRWRRGVDTYGNPNEALLDVARLYRKDLWRSADRIVEVWLEKEALAGVVSPVSDEWAVHLMVTRGYPSVSYLHSAAEYVRAAGKPLTILYLVDFDPSGQDIPRAITARLDDFGVDFELQQVAVTAEQIEEWDLPTRPTKKSDTRSKGFSDHSVELDAIPAPTLRRLVDDAIRVHVDEHRFSVLRAVEEEERETLYALARGFGHE